MRLKHLSLLLLASFIFINTNCKNGIDEAANVNTERTKNSATKSKTSKANKSKNSLLKNAKYSKKRTMAKFYRINGKKNNTKISSKVKEIKFYGFAIDYPNKNSASEVFIEVNDKLHKTKYGLSSDNLIKRFNNNNYSNCSFRAKIPIKEFNLGENKITIVVLNNTENSYYRVATASLNVN